MCTPLTGLAVGSGALNFLMGQAQASSAIENQNKLAQMDSQQITEQQIQTNKQAALDATARNKQGMIERAAISNEAGESGALGISTDRLASNSLMQEGTDLSYMEAKRVNEMMSYQNKQMATQLKAESNINAINNATPTLIGTGLQIGSDIYASNKAAKTKAIATTGI